MADTECQTYIVDVYLSDNSLKANELGHFDVIDYKMFENSKWRIRLGREVIS